MGLIPIPPDVLPPPYAPATSDGTTSELANSHQNETSTQQIKSVTVLLSKLDRSRRRAFIIIIVETVELSFLVRDCYPTAAPARVTLIMCLSKSASN